MRNFLTDLVAELKFVCGLAIFGGLLLAFMVWALALPPKAGMIIPKEQRLLTPLEAQKEIKRHLAEQQELLVAKKVAEQRSFSAAIDRAPLVKAYFDRSRFSLAEFYFTDEALAKMAEEDKEFGGPYANQNGFAEFKTSAGTFKVVYCYDRHSVDEKAKHRGGWRSSSVQLPSGKWMRDVLFIHKTFEVDGDVYLICRGCVLKWVGNDTIEYAVKFDGAGTKWSPYISVSKAENGALMGKYFAVNKSNESNFGGLLEYVVKSGWKFHQYDGDYSSWLETMELKGNRLAIRLFSWDAAVAGKEILFNPAKGTFADQ